MRESKFKKILVTGGAGFVGSFLVDRLIQDGYKVRVLDSLEEQVNNRKKPAYLNSKAEFVRGDVRKLSVFQKVLDGVDAVFHLAASVGVGQSNYQIKKYIDTNIGGTANLLELLVNRKNRIKKIITISSMTGYGEGNYSCQGCGVVRPGLREIKQLRKKDWSIYCPNCKKTVIPIATDEKALDFPNSVYGLSKKVQQDLFLMLGRLYDIPAVVLRGFNIYGPRQSLSNPYTGVTAIFISRLKNNQPAVIFEDGLQTRDFVSVHDVVDAFVMSLKSDAANFQMFNIGSGKGTAILDVAQTLSSLLGKRGLITINNEFRKNDIKHCFADISKAKKILGWKPKVSLKEGFSELIEWGSKEKSDDKFFQAQKELRQKRLI